MSQIADKILNRVENLNTYRRGDRRAPHKPLLLLMALAKLKNGKNRIHFPDVEEQLRPLLNAYAPPVSARHQPELPYWHLQSDGLWHVEGAELLERQRGGFPRISALRETSAGFPDDVAQALQSEDGLVEQIVHAVLEEHFPASMHEDIIAAVGLGAIGDTWQVREPSIALKKVRPRDPNFRKKVLRAYEHRCAVTGFRAALGGSYFGCEAGHVQWHAFGGPDTVENGISMELTIHKLFDAGACYRYERVH